MFQEQDAVSATDFDFEAKRIGEIAMEPARKLDNQLHVQFYKHGELNSFASREAGRKIFEDFTYIRIMAPANRSSIVERRATDDDKMRFSAQYARYLQGMEQLASGTPLTELPSLTPSQVMELRALKVTTVEQLGGLPDTTVQILGTGGQELKQRALRYLDKTTDASKQGDRIRSLEQQLAELLAERAVEREKAAAAPAQVTVTEGTQKAPPKA